MRMLQMLKWMSSLSFEDLGIDDEAHAKDGLHLEISDYITYALLFIEGAIFFVSLFQLIRFCKYSRLYLKKVIHVLIMFQMLVCISQAIKLPHKYDAFLHETTFALCSLIYFIVLLFWCDFYTKLRWATAIKFLTSRLFVVAIVAYVLAYMTAFSLFQVEFFGVEDWTLTSYMAFWHLCFFTIMAAAMFVITLKITSAIYGLYWSVRIRFFKKTAKLLVLVCFCFVIRVASALLLVCIHHATYAVPAGWHSQVGFFFIYFLDRIFPVIVFMILMRNTPSKGSVDGASLLKLNSQSSLVYTQVSGSVLYT